MHWLNSNFQIRHFIAGKCHTADEAYRVLTALKEERQIALKSAEASALRQEAKELRARERVMSSQTIERLEAQADLLDIEATRQQVRDCIVAAEQELAYINVVLAEIEPHRQYRGLPDSEAHQLAQQAEWKAELIWRADNLLKTVGHLSPELLSTMRLHPDWDSAISPELHRLVAESRYEQGLLSNDAED